MTLSVAEDPEAGQYGAAIFPQHARMLAESAIDPEVARERGYVSVDTKKRLESAGFADYQRRVPGLLIPVHGVSGTTHQYRPDKPRKVTNKGKVRFVKYETPGGSQMVLDVPPRARARIGDPKIPLWITEGVKKADAGVSAGLCCVAVLGVDAWRGTNSEGGKVALADWEAVALNDGRPVFVVYDSDVMLKRDVHRALVRLGAMLTRRGAQVAYVYLPAGESGAKVGLDDYFRAGGTVDDLVLRTRSEPVEPELPEEPPAPEAAASPMPDADVDGAQALDDIDAFIRRYVVFPDDCCSVAVTLFAAHTHVVECFYVTPRLILDSAEPESGKTRVLELLALLCRNPKMTFNTTVAALYRRLLDKMLTVLLDEADAIWSAKAGPQAEELRAFVNSGYKRGATVDRCVGDGAGMKVVEFPVFAPVAIAGIAGNMPPTVTSRAVTIHMRRRAPGDRISPYEEQDVMPEAQQLRARLAGWTATIEGTLKAARPDMPEGVTDRKAEVWRALLAVADAAGGDWPKRAREACAHFALGTAASDVSLGVRLLADLKAIFGERDRMTTVDILEKLTGMEEAPWGDMPRSHKPLDARGLSNLVKRYDVHPTAFKPLDGTDKAVKGYTTYQTGDGGNVGLADAWRRYADKVGNQGDDGNSAGAEPDRANPVTDEPVTGNSPKSALTSEVTELTEVTDSDGDDWPSWPDDVCASTPAQLAQVSPQVSEGCAPVRLCAEGAGDDDAHTCTVCGEPLDPALVKAGYTDHGEAQQ